MQRINHFASTVPIPVPVPGIPSEEEPTPNKPRSFVRRCDGLFHVKRNIYNTKFVSKFIFIWCLKII